MEVRGKRYKFTEADLKAGTEREMEVIKDRKEARRVALKRLQRHPTYYRLLPVAEQVMTLQERKDPLKKKPKRRRRAPAGPGMPNFGFNLGF